MSRLGKSLQTIAYVGGMMIGGALLACLGALTYYLWLKAESLKARTFNVQAKVSKTVRPSVAVIELYVVDEGSDLVELQKQVTSRINKVYQFIKEVGVASNNIKTLDYNVTPKYDYRSNKRAGYRMEQGIRVRVKDLNKVSLILQKSVEYGANRINGPKFEVPNREELEEVLLKEAINKAQSKAEEIASQTGIELLRVVNVHVKDHVVPQPVYRSLGTGVNISKELPVVEPGENKISMEVELVYEIR